jgi:quercetin dioxygenase-like cupin family protein
MTDARDRYFSFDPTAAAQGGGFVNVDQDVETVTFSEGLTFSPVLGDNVMVNVVDFAPHTEAPLHIHDEEQVTIVLTGSLEFTVGSETRLMRPGDIAVIPSNVPHGGRTLDEASREIDVFHPPRRALLDLMNSPPPAP